MSDLKDHFSREATNDIESVFLISKSNCAFVNYKSEEACATAMSRFHDSRYQGVRLVCRLRRGSAASVSPTKTDTSTVIMDQATAISSSEVLDSSQDDELSLQALALSEPSKTPQVKEKFFIVKSLTIEDLELSLRNGIWATQSHNEAALNQAFEVSCV